MEEQKEFKEFSNFDPTKDLSLAPQRRTKRGLGIRQGYIDTNGDIIVYAVDKETHI